MLPPASVHLQDALDDAIRIVHNLPSPSRRHYSYPHSTHPVNAPHDAKVAEHFLLHDLRSLSPVVSSFLVSEDSTPILTPHQAAQPGATSLCWISAGLPLVLHILRGDTSSYKRDIVEGGTDNTFDQFAERISSCFFTETNNSLGNSHRQTLTTMSDEMIPPHFSTEVIGPLLWTAANSDSHSKGGAGLDLSNTPGRTTAFLATVSPHLRRVIYEYYSGTVTAANPTLVFDSRRTSNEQRVDPEEPNIVLERILQHINISSSTPPLFTKVSDIVSIDSLRAFWAMSSLIEMMPSAISSAPHPTSPFLWQQASLCSNNISTNSSTESEIHEVLFGYIRGHLLVDGPRRAADMVCILGLLEKAAASSCSSYEEYKMCHTTRRKELSNPISPFDASHSSSFPPCAYLPPQYLLQKHTQVLLAALQALHPWWCGAPDYGPIQHPLFLEELFEIHRSATALAEQAEDDFRMLVAESRRCNGPWPSDLSGEFQERSPQAQRHLDGCLFIQMHKEYAAECRHIADVTLLYVLQTLRDIDEYIIHSDINSNIGSANNVDGLSKLASIVDEGADYISSHSCTRSTSSASAVKDYMRHSSVSRPLFTELLQQSLAQCYLRLLLVMLAQVEDEEYNYNQKSIDLKTQCSVSNGQDRVGSTPISSCVRDTAILFIEMCRKSTFISVKSPYGTQSEHTVTGRGGDVVETEENMLYHRSRTSHNGQVQPPKESYSRWQYLSSTSLCGSKMGTSSNVFPTSLLLACTTLVEWNDLLPNLTSDIDPIVSGSEARQQRRHLFFSPVCEQIIRVVLLDVIPALFTWADVVTWVVSDPKWMRLLSFFTKENLILYFNRMVLDQRDNVSDGSINCATNFDNKKQSHKIQDAYMYQHVYRYHNLLLIHLVARGSCSVFADIVNKKQLQYAKYVTILCRMPDLGLHCVEMMSLVCTTILDQQEHDQDQKSLQSNPSSQTSVTNNRYRHESYQYFEQLYVGGVVSLVVSLLRELTLIAGGSSSSTISASSPTQPKEGTMNGLLYPNSQQLYVTAEQHSEVVRWIRALLPVLLGTDGSSGCGLFFRLTGDIESRELVLSYLQQYYFKTTLKVMDVEGNDECVLSRALQIQNTSSSKPTQEQGEPLMSLSEAEMILQVLFHHTIVPCQFNRTSSNCSSNSNSVDTMLDMMICRSSSSDSLATNSSTNKGEPYDGDDIEVACNCWLDQRRTVYNLIRLLSKKTSTARYSADGEMNTAPNINCSISLVMKHAISMGRNLVKALADAVASGQQTDADGNKITLENYAASMATSSIISKNSNSAQQIYYYQTYYGTISTMAIHQSRSGVSPVHIEALLRYVYELGQLEGDGLGVQDTSSSLAYLVEMILHSYICYYPHSAVHLALFELYDRYNMFFVFARSKPKAKTVNSNITSPGADDEWDTNRGSIISARIDALLHQLLLLPCGVLNPTPRVRSRICYMFCKMCSSVLRPHLQTLYRQQMGAMIGSGYEGKPSPQKAEEITKALLNAIMMADNEMNRGDGHPHRESGCCDVHLLSHTDKVDLFEGIGCLLAPSSLSVVPIDQQEYYQHYHSILISLCRQLAENVLLCDVEDAAGAARREVQSQSSQSASRLLIAAVSETISHRLAYLTAFMKGLSSVLGTSGSPQTSTNTTVVSSQTNNKVNISLQLADVFCGVAERLYELVRWAVSEAILIHSQEYGNTREHKSSPLLHQLRDGLCGFTHQLINILSWSHSSYPSADNLTSSIEKFVIEFVNIMMKKDSSGVCATTELTRILRVIHQYTGRTYRSCSSHGVHTPEAGLTRSDSSHMTMCSLSSSLRVIGEVLLPLVFSAFINVKWKMINHQLDNNGCSGSFFPDLRVLPNLLSEASVIAGTGGDYSYTNSSHTNNNSNSNNIRVILSENIKIDLEAHKTFLSFFQLLAGGNSAGGGLGIDVFSHYFLREIVKVTRLPQSGHIDGQEKEQELQVLVHFLQQQLQPSCVGQQRSAITVLQQLLRDQMVDLVNYLLVDCAGMIATSSLQSTQLSPPSGALEYALSILQRNSNQNTNRTANPEHFLHSLAECGGVSYLHLCGEWGGGLIFHNSPNITNCLSWGNYQPHQNHYAAVSALFSEVRQLSNATNSASPPAGASSSTCYSNNFSSSAPSSLSTELFEIPKVAMTTLSRLTASWWSGGNFEEDHEREIQNTITAVHHELQAPQIQSNRTVTTLMRPFFHRAFEEVLFGKIVPSIIDLFTHVVVDVVSVPSRVNAGSMPTAPHPQEHSKVLLVCRPACDLSEGRTHLLVGEFCYMLKLVLLQSILSVSYITDASTNVHGNQNSNLMLERVMQRLYDTLTAPSSNSTSHKVVSDPTTGSGQTITPNVTLSNLLLEIPFISTASSITSHTSPAIVLLPLPSLTTAAVEPNTAYEVCCKLRDECNTSSTGCSVKTAAPCGTNTSHRSNSQSIAGSGSPYNNSNNHSIATTRVSTKFKTSFKELLRTMQQQQVERMRVILLEMLGKSKTLQSEHARQDPYLGCDLSQGSSEGVLHLVDVM